MKFQDDRIGKIVEALRKIATGDFKSQLRVSDDPVELDVVFKEINMLSREISSRMEAQAAENQQLSRTIRELKQRRTELSHSEQLFQQVFHTSPDGISISRLETGEFVEVNKSFELMTGLSRKELIGHSVFDLNMWLDTTLREQMVKELKTNGIYRNLEADFRVSDGSIRRGLMSATLIEIDEIPHLISIARDITEIREAERRLRDTEIQFRELIQLAPDGIILTDTDGRIQHCNKAFLKISGLNREEAIGLHFNEFRAFFQKDVPRYKKIFGEVMKGNVPRPFIMEFMSGEQRRTYLEVHISPNHQGDEINGAQAVIRDITERVEATEALQRSEAQYRSSMDAMHNAVCVMDRDLNVILVNKALRRGLEEAGQTSDIIGRYYLDAFPLLPKKSLAEYRQVLETGRPMRREEVVVVRGLERHSDVHLIPIKEGGEVVRVLTIIQDITERKKADRVQEIMYNISNAVNLTKDLSDLLHSIQKELDKIFDARNFFIALYNKEEDTLSLPFFVDEKDTFETWPAQKTLTGYMLKKDKPLLMQDPEIRELTRQGLIEDVGTPSKIWLGVPLKIKEETIGALVIQNYENEEAYNEKDLEILGFVSSQVSLSIETKRAYEEVQIEKAYFEQLFEGSPETILLISNDGKLLKVNSQFEKLFGYTADEVMGRHIDQVIVPDEYLEEARDYTERLARGVSIRTESVRKHKDGRRLHVSILGTPIEIGGGQVAVLGIYRDISDRKNAEFALRESEEKLRNILYSSPDAITVSDLRGFITECNQAAASLFGFQQEKELIGMNAIEMLKQEHRDYGVRQLKRVLRQGSVKNVDFELHTGQPDPIHVSLSASLIHDRNDRPIGIAAITQDITERHHYEAQLRNAKEQAEESDRLKSAFLANMSHEIRTPMNAILGFSELLRNDELPEDTRKEYLRIINSKGNELLLIINDIIDISKIEAGDIQIVCEELRVNEFLNAAHLELREEKELMSKNQLQLRLNIPVDDNPVIQTDQARLKQILYNLVNNAFKFTHEGFIETGYNIQNDSVVFYVQDTGIGIAGDKQEMIFDRFRQVDESLNSEFGGTGLGLAISKNLVELLGGQIWVESVEDQGSTFYFSIPLLKNESDVIQLKEHRYARTPEDPIDLSGKKILVAEDDSANYLFIETYLHEINSEIIWARDGFEAVEMYRKEEGIDLILMDIRMPNRDGIEATRIIRNSDPRIPIVALTAYAFADDREASLQSGCNEYLSKPVKLEELGQTLRKYLFDGCQSPD